MCNYYPCMAKCAICWYSDEVSSFLMIQCTDFKSIRKKCLKLSNVAFYQDNFVHTPIKGNKSNEWPIKLHVYANLIKGKHQAVIFNYCLHQLPNSGAICASICWPYQLSRFKLFCNISTFCSISKSQNRYHPVSNYLVTFLNIQVSAMIDHVTAFFHNNFVMSSHVWSWSRVGPEV